MALRDVELDVAQLLEAAGLGSMATSPPTLYAGYFPADKPEQLVAVRDTGGDDPEEHLGTGGAIFHPEVQVLVRAGTRTAARELAVASYEALRLKRTDAYALIRPAGSGPLSSGKDANGRHVFTFNVELEYAAASAPGGEVVPLPSSGPLTLPALEVTGDVTVGGLLRRPVTDQADTPSTEVTASTPLGRLLAPAGTDTVLVNNPLVRADSLVRAWMMNAPVSGTPRAAVDAAYVTQPGQFAIAMTDTTTVLDFVICWEVLT